jgi:hypothetical protein
MKENKWKIEYKDEEWSSIYESKAYNGRGFYEITFDGNFYGFISKDSWDKKSTGEILGFVEAMLNDAHNLALTIKEEQ